MLKKGVSPAITAAILIVAAVVIGLLVVGYMYGIFGAVTGTPRATVESLSLTCDPNGNFDIEAKVYYVSGKGPISCVNVTVLFVNGTGIGHSEVALSINPGSIALIRTTISGANVKCMPGNTYIVYMKAARDSDCNIIFIDPLVRQSVVAG